MEKSYEITIDELLHELNSEDERAVEKALRQLAHFEGEFDPQPVIKCLKINNNYIKEYSARILGKLNSPKATNALIRLLSDPDNNVREKAALALGDPKQIKAVKALVIAADDEDDYVREAVVWSLGEIGDEKALDTLVSRTRDKDGYVSRRAMEALVKIGKGNIEAILQSLLNNKNLEEQDISTLLYELIYDENEIRKILEHRRTGEKYIFGTVKPRLKLKEMLSTHSNILEDLDRRDLIRYSVENKEAVITSSGRLATWNYTESTGRSPQDTLTVKRPESQNQIDWSSPNCIPMTIEHFDMIFKDAVSILSEKGKIYITNRCIGADPKYSLMIRTVTSSALTALFTMNMFRSIPEQFSESVFSDKEFLLLVLPHDKLNQEKYKGILRELPDGHTSSMAIAMDYDRKIGVVIGSAYLGSVKKLMFTAMNYYLPEVGILPLHCSANEGFNDDVSLFLGLSGTGKTTLSADPYRKLLGDDEHGWSDNGIFNFENGCYAKLINLSQDKEPEIYNTVMQETYYLDNGAIIENAMIYPNGHLDLNDARLTPNSRLSFPLNMLSNIKESSMGAHPKTIIFLTADAYGVLPPLSKLDKNQAMLWFLMGYTSKLAGTETGIVEPSATFSRFFGQPFMPRKPQVYAGMLGEKLEKYNSAVYLINTGWTGGKYGQGRRIDLILTRSMIYSALSGELDSVEWTRDELFHLNIPKSCPNVPDDMLNPVNTWKNKTDYKNTALKLAKAFSDHFDKVYGDKGIDPDIISQCPGK